MIGFTAQLGHVDHLGLLTGKQRLARIEQGRNSYVTGASLPSDSPVFFGCEQALAKALGVLRRPDKPGNVSVLEERRSGKSSFLNQLYGALAAEPGLVSIRATTQDWSDARSGRFFHGLYQISWVYWTGPLRLPHRQPPAPEGAVPGATDRGILLLEHLRHHLVHGSTGRTGGPKFGHRAPKIQPAPGPVAGPSPSLDPGGRALDRLPPGPDPAPPRPALERLIRGLPSRSGPDRTEPTRPPGGPLV